MFGYYREEMVTCDQADDVKICSNYSSPMQHYNVGLSLKARQNGAESLKRIFNQIMQSNTYNCKYNSDCIITQKAPPPQRQLTIFYKGVVHVFDDVNIDKAQAIMLLASGMNGTESNSMDENQRFQSNCTETIHYGKATPVINNNNWNTANVNYKTGPSNSTNSNCSTAASDGRSNEQTNSTPISRPTALIVQRSHAELPYARKASLARFFAKRKDRTELCNDGNNNVIKGVSSSNDLNVEINTTKQRTDQPAANYDHPQKRICY